MDANKAGVVFEICKCVYLLEYAHDHKLYLQSRTCFTVEHLKIIKSFEQYR